MENNAESSGTDLADLSFYGPSWKYRYLYRPVMKFRVTLDYLLIVPFSRNPRLKDARF